MAEYKPIYTPKKNNFNINFNNNDLYFSNYNQSHYQNYLTINNESKNKNKIKRRRSPIQILNPKKFNFFGRTQKLNNDTEEKKYLNKSNAKYYDFLRSNQNNQSEDINNNTVKTSALNIKNIFTDRLMDYQNELLLKIFNYIYYYEKALSEKNIFINSIEKYYLINPSWLDEFKKFYSYNKLKAQLSLAKKYDFSQIDLYINVIIKSIPKTIKLNYKKLPLNLKTNILSTYKGYILPQKIMNIIYELDNDFITIGKPNAIISYFNSIYYIKNKTIIYGTYKKSALLEPKYIFEYDSNEIESKEERILVYSDIEDYISEKKCNTENYRQVLENGEKRIGILIIPNIQRQPSKRKKIHS